MRRDIVSVKLILCVGYLAQRKMKASVWVVMRTVTVPTCEDWGQAPRMQVALSGVFAIKEEAEKAAQT